MWGVSGERGQRFGRCDLTFVGDRGMITQARIEALRTLDGASWITALRAPQVKALVQAGAIQLSLLNESNLAEITHPGYPGERLVVCRNPAVAAERVRKRAALLAATEEALAKLAPTVAAGGSPTTPALRAGRILDKHKVGKHFDITVEQATISWSRRTEQVAAEAACDGIYITRTPWAKPSSRPPGGVGVYKSLSEIEADTSAAGRGPTCSCARSTTGPRWASPRTVETSP